MNPNCLVRNASLLLLAAASLSAQNVIPLRNWATPLYWQPNPAERKASGQATPELQYSANQVSDVLSFIAITPCRLVDTRGAAAGFNGVAPFSGPSITAAGTLTIPVQSPYQTSTTAPAPCGAIPSMAEAYSFNVTVVPHAAGAVDYVSIWPSGGAQPFVATLNDPQGAIVSNAAIVPAGAQTAGPIFGGVSVYNAGPSATDVIIDMNGYFASLTGPGENTAVGLGTLVSDTTGGGNTASGAYALMNNTTGFSDTATGDGALEANTVGADNTASGFFALTANTTGADNTATGTYALQNNLTGNFNTADGQEALQYNTTGSLNTATGGYSLVANTTGSYNTATGVSALNNNTTGTYNTAVGVNSLVQNAIGNFNTALGAEAMFSNTGNANTATGFNALTNISTGNNNTAMGVSALFSNTTGSNNVAIGYLAGANVNGGNVNNIHVGTAGQGADNNTIRIGTVGTQTSAFIAGISGEAPGTPNLPVCIDANGQLGTMGCTNTPSSLRFKEQISDMGDRSNRLLQLRPVTFFYKPQYDDGTHALQYGLIAEEVAKLYPDMVGYDQDGQPSSVKYQSLTPMLLNEVQKQNAHIQSLEDRLAALEALLSGDKASQ